ncbi:unnamed protein product, partial [marine sediment metagenome]
KWSPSQVVEHIARTYEESAHVVTGGPTKFPTFPFFIRPVLRIVFNRTVKKGSFMKAKTMKPFDPVSGPTSTDEGRARVEAALEKFERACQAQSADGTMSSGVFGKVAVSDYVQFQALHTRHHQKQLVVGQ